MLKSYLHNFDKSRSTQGNEMLHKNMSKCAVQNSE